MVWFHRLPLLILVLGLLWTLGQMAPTLGVGATSLSQAPTPTPSIASIGGVPISAPYAPDGNNLLGVSCESGCTAASTGPTQIPGVYTTAVVANATVALTPATTPQVAAKPQRLYLICTNDSDADSIYLSPAGTAATRAGIRLNPGGAAYEMSERLGNLSLGGVWAASATAGNTLTCVEGSR